VFHPPQGIMADGVALQVLDQPEGSEVLALAVHQRKFQFQETLFGQFEKGQSIQKKGSKSEQQKFWLV
jgi:hypothetical protein